MNNVISRGINTIHGDVDNLDMRGGVCFLKGNVGSMTQYGGVVYDQRPSDRVEIRESEMSVQLERYYKNRIDELETKLIKSDNECFKLREKLKKIQNIDPEADPDDVLVQRICSLINELKKEREAHRKDVEELNERMDVAMEVNASLRNEIADPDEKDREIAERHVDILATIMALYPFTPTDNLTYEFGIPQHRISYVATALGVLKSKDERDKAREYLQKQGLQLIERRGGDQGNYPKRKTIEKVSRNGRVIATYKSIQEAAEMNNLTASCVSDHCRGRIKCYTLKGYKFRYKNNEDYTIA